MTPMIFIFICTNNNKTSDIFFICTSNNKTSDSESISKKASHLNSRQRGVRVTEKGKVKILAAKAAGIANGERLTYQALAEKANVSTKTVQRFLNGERVDKDYARAILNVLNLEAQDILEDS